MRLRILAALSVAVLAVGVLPAAAQDSTDSGGALGDGLPVDALGGADGDMVAQQEAASSELPDTGEEARFVATADGGAFDIRLGDDSLTVGHSQVGIQSAARGSACEGELSCALAAGEAVVSESAQVSTSDGSVSDTAAAVELTEFELLEASLGTASVRAEASSTTSAAAEGRVLSADVSLVDGVLNGSGGQFNGQLQDLLDSLGGLDTGTGGSSLGLGELSSQLDPRLDNLDAGQIEDILSGSGLGLAAASSAATTSTSPLQVAQQLVDANQATGSDDAGDGSDGSTADSNGGGLLDDLTGGGAQDAVNGIIGGGDTDGDGGSDTNLDAGAASVEEIASLLEDATGGAAGDQLAVDSDDGPTDSDGLIRDVTNALEDLTNDLTEQPLATVRVGPTTSLANDDGSVTRAEASSNGAVVVVLPTEDSTRQNPRGLATVQVGSASASVDSDRSDANASFDPAIVRLSVANRLADGGVEEITVDAGESKCAGAEPLELCVSVGEGNTTVDGSGASASANAVSISALGDPLPELSVDLAAATANVNSAPAVQDADVEPQKKPQGQLVDQQLPKTGGGALVPGLLLIGAGAAGFAGLRRRR